MILFNLSCMSQAKPKSFSSKHVMEPEVVSLVSHQMPFHGRSCELITPLLLMFLPINTVTEVNSLAEPFFLHLFGLLMIGYQIPISFSCVGPSSLPCSLL